MLEASNKQAKKLWADEYSSRITLIICEPFNFFYFLFLFKTCLVSKIKLKIKRFVFQFT
jgi:hypothetical protein